MSFKAKTESRLPGSSAPLDQLGLKIALGMEKYPSDRMLMLYGPPGSGKSTLMYLLIGQYVKNGDNVWLVDQERAIDNVYLASYIPNLDGDKEELLAFQHGLKEAEARVKKEDKLKDSERTMTDENLEKLKKRVELLKKILSKKNPEDADEIPQRTRRSLLLTCRADYRVRNIRIVSFDTIEEFEKEVTKNVKERLANPEENKKRLLIGVDSINYLLPKEVLERESCSEGSNFVVAKYLHTLLPKFITKVAGTETSILFIHQETKHIKMNFWEQSNPIDDVATKGGSAAKFGATLMIGVTKKKKVKGMNEKEYDSGVINIPKMKLRGGSKGTFKGVFFLKEGVEKSVMDFNEPFIITALEESSFGIEKVRGKFFVPLKLVKDHPEFDTIIKPKLKPLPKDESDNPELYYQDDEEQLVEILCTSPAFEEECLNFYEIPEDV